MEASHPCCPGSSWDYSLPLAGCILGQWKKARLWKLVTLVVLVALGITACQGSGSEAPGQIATSGESTEQSASSQGGQQGTGQELDQEKERDQVDEPERIDQLGRTHEAPGQEETLLEPTNTKTATPTGQKPGVTLDRIAYVNATGDLFTIDPDGTGLRSLTAGVQASAGSGGRVLTQPLNLDRFHAWPTWSPDGSKLAVSRVQIREGGRQISLEVIDIATAQARTVYENSSGGLVAQGTPHYIYWSPASRYLSFLASTSDGLSLFIKDTQDDTEPVRVSTGAPLYWNWSPDSSRLVLHNGADLMLAGTPFEQEPTTLLSSASPFRVPAISPDGLRFAYISVDQDGAFLAVAPIDSPLDGSNLLEVGALSAFAWSPDGTEIAVADQSDGRTPVYQRLLVVSATDGSQVRTIGDEAFLAFFWSPEGDGLAWVALDLDSRSFEWIVADKSGDLIKRLFKFQPSNDSLTMLSFFDQYAYSNSPWSPDGTRLVVAGTPEGVARPSNGQSASRDRVFILDAAGDSPPLDIARGTVAFWSWN